LSARATGRRQRVHRGLLFSKNAIFFAADHRLALFEVESAIGASVGVSEDTHQLVSIQKTHRAWCWVGFDDQEGGLA
jgi:hypothetical protein